jgi:hypothetical protein
MSTQGIPKEEVQRRAKVRAELTEQRRLDASRALEDQKAFDKAEKAKTKRLRALRLAREAAEQAEVKPAVKKARTPAKSTPKKKAAAANS